MVSLNSLLLHLLFLIPFSLTVTVIAGVVVVPDGHVVQNKACTPYFLHILHEPGSGSHIQNMPFYEQPTKRSFDVLPHRLLLLGKQLLLHGSRLGDGLHQVSILRIYAVSEKVSALKFCIPDRVLGCGCCGFHLGAG